MQFTFWNLNLSTFFCKHTGLQLQLACNGQSIGFYCVCWVEYTISYKYKLIFVNFFCTGIYTGLQLQLARNGWSIGFYCRRNYCLLRNTRSVNISCQCKMPKICAVASLSPQLWHYGPGHQHLWFVCEILCSTWIVDVPVQWLCSKSMFDEEYTNVNILHAKGLILWLTRTRVWLYYEEYTITMSLSRPNFCAVAGCPQHSTLWPEPLWLLTHLCSRCADRCAHAHWLCSKSMFMATLQHGNNVVAQTLRQHDDTTPAFVLNRCARSSISMNLCFFVIYVHHI